MIIIIIICSIISLLFISAGIYGLKNDLDNAEFALMLGCFGLFITIAMIRSLNNIIEEKENSIKVDLPEEIWNVRQGDTLYINKRTKDSIYLGFKQLK